MKIWNFGSLNLDHVYRVDEFPRPGETRKSLGYSLFCGGKGLNQSIAAARAGCAVCHVGAVGQGGEPLLELLDKNGVETGLLERLDTPNGHAVIQVDLGGQNCILLFGGSNQGLSREYVAKVLDRVGPEDLVLLQNETNLVDEIISLAHARNLRLAFNAAPMDEAVPGYPLEKLNWLIVNEIEGARLSGRDPDRPEAILDSLAQKYPAVGILLTLGRHGVLCQHKGERLDLDAHPVTAVDSTAAGDAFIGFFLHGIISGHSLARALDLANLAGALCVTRAGAADSIPTLAEVEEAAFALTKHV